MFKIKANLFLCLLSVLLGSTQLQAADKYWIGPAGGSFEDNANWSLSTGGANDTTFPTNIDKALFDVGNTNDCSIDSAIFVAGIDIQSGYTGTITQDPNREIKVGGSHFSQAGGTFIGSDKRILTNAGCNFVLSGGSFTSTSDIFTIDGTITVSGSPTFNHNGGTVKFAIDTDKTVVPGSLVFNHVIINQSSNDFSVTGTMDVDGDLFIKGLGEMSGTITVAGNLDTTRNLVSVLSASDNITMDGTGDQNITASDGTGALPGLVINKASGTLTIKDDTLTISGNIIHLAGAVVCTGTIELRNIGTVTHSVDNMSFNNLVLNPFSTISATGIIDINGNLSVDNLGTNAPMTVAGNVSSGEPSGFGTASLTLDGSGNQEIFLATGEFSQGNFIVNKSGGVAKLMENFVIDDPGQDLIIEEGTLNLNGFDLTVADAFTIESGGNLQLFGSETVAVTGTQDIQLGSTYIFTGDNDTLADTYTISNYQSVYGNLEINSSDGALDSFDTASDISVSGNFSLLSGNYSMGAFNLTVAANLIIDTSLSQTAGDLAAASIVVSATGDWQNHSTGDVTLGSGGVTSVCLK